MPRFLEISAKIRPPRLPHIVHRTRLYDQIYDQQKTYPITWITGAAGMGKTTLAAGYLQKHNRRHVWYQLDAGDADPATFFHYLGQLGRQAAPRFRQPLPSLTPEYLPALPIFARRYFEKLFSRLKNPTVLVFDNYQDVPLDSVFHEVLTQGLRDLPEHIQVIVLSRGGIPPEWATLRASQEMTHLMEDELQFTKQEAASLLEFLGARKKVRLAPADQQRLQQQAKGWAAGLVLLMECQAQVLSQGATTQEQDPQAVFDYLAQEIWNGCEPATQTLLKAVAWMPSVSVKQANALSNMSQAGTILAELCRYRFFTERQEGVEPRYRFHPLFQRFLRNRVRVELASEVLQDLQVCSANQLAVDGNEEEAIDVLLAGRLFEEASARIMQVAPMIANQGRLKELQSWIETLPPAVYQQEPWMSYWLGVCRMPFAPADAKPLFEAAFNGFKTTRVKSEGVLLAYCGVMNAISIEWNDLSLLDPWLARLPEVLLPDEFEQLPLPMKGMVASSVFGALMWRDTDHPDIDFWLTKAIAHIQNIPNVMQQYSSAFHIGGFLGWKGQPQRALDLLDKLQHRNSVEQFSPLVQAIYYASQAMGKWYAGAGSQYPQVLERCTRLLEDETVTGIFRSLVLSNFIYKDLEAGNVYQANEYIELYCQLAKQAPGQMKGHYFFVSAWAAVLEGDFERAWLEEQQAYNSAKKIGEPYSIADTGLALSEVFFDLGNIEKMESHFIDTFEMANRMGFPMLQLRGWLLQYRRARKEGKEDQAQFALRTGMALGRSRKVMTFPFWRPDIMAKICQEALEQGIEVDYIRSLICQRGLRPTAPPLHVTLWPWPVKVKTLGNFSIEVDDHEIHFGRKVPRRVLALLKAIIAFGGQRVKEDKLIDALWPESDGDRAYRSYATALHRLRKLLGDESLIVVKDGKVSLDADRCWVDVWAFDYLLDQAGSAKNEGDKKQSVDLSEQATQLYQGPFLRDDEDVLWATRLRERIRKTYMTQFEQLCQAWTSDGKVEEARALFHQAREQEQGIESLQRGLGL